MGAHPFHHRCLELYSCLASACRVCAKTGAGCIALRQAALYGLMQSAGAEAMLAVGAGSSLRLSSHPGMEQGTTHHVFQIMGNIRSQASKLLMCSLSSGNSQASARMWVSSS